MKDKPDPKNLFCDISLSLMRFAQKGLLIISFVLTVSATKSQSISWKMAFHGFADNREYKSKVQIPQTFMGTLFIPEMGFHIDSLHTIHAGFSTLFEFGTDQFQDRIFPQLYYHFSGEKFHFTFGSFPRHQVMPDAPLVVYYDSLNYFRPYINGLFWTYCGNSFHQSLYLDWTSRQTFDRRETFIMGAQGRYTAGILFATYHLYMYHYAKTANPAPGEYIRDNGVLYFLLGYNAAPLVAMDTLSIGVGGVQSYERARNDMVWHTPYGMIMEIKAQYKGFGLKNTLYCGQGHQLDWGDPYYRLKRYNRLDIYFTPLRFQGVEGRFGISLHFAEKRINHQQQFFCKILLVPPVKK